MVLSRRAWLEQTQSEDRGEFLNQLARGQVRKGVVSSVVNFGAFVDLGGVDGLVHVSELSWKHIDHPSEVVEVGQEVTVEVLDVDLDRERVSLSLKATQEDPWRLYARTHAIGQIVPGKVTKLVPFGAFVRVEEGIEGLVHISELAERHVESPSRSSRSATTAWSASRHRPRPAPDLALAQAGQRGDDGRHRVRPHPLRHGRRVRRAGQLILPRALRRGDRRLAGGLQGPSATPGRRSTAEADERYEQHIAQIRKAAEADAARAPTRGDELFVPGRGRPR